MEEKIKTLKEIYKLGSENCTNNTPFDYDTVGSEGYGETGYNTFKQLIDKYQEYFNDDAVFYDLGSGCGKLVFHVGIMCNAKKSCGIEFSKERYEYSIKTLDKYNYENISFINDNILATTKLLDSTKEYGKLKKFIHISTDEIYGGNNNNISYNYLILILFYL